MSEFVLFLCWFVYRVGTTSVLVSMMYDLTNISDTLKFIIMVIFIIGEATQLMIGASQFPKVFQRK